MEELRGVRGCIGVGHSVPYVHIMFPLFSEKGIVGVVILQSLGKLKVLVMFGPGGGGVPAAAVCVCWCEWAA